MDSEQGSVAGGVSNRKLCWRGIRGRCFLNARAATAMAEPVARLLAGELGRDEAWITAQVIEFHGLAKQYRVT